jgi:hypothetical protein
MDVKDLLCDLGYNIQDFGNYWTCQAKYRDGNDPNSIAIYPNDNAVIDFVVGEKFTIETLIGKTIGLKNDEEVQRFLTQKSCLVVKNVHFNPKILTCKTYDGDCLSRLAPNHDYWIKRGISKNLLEKFRGGFCRVEKFKNRYVFPIFRLENNKEDIIGFSGRSINPNEKIRWLHHGSKSFWVYPTFLNDDLLKDTKKIILVEGIGDMLSLWECGIYNTICTFGIEMCKAILIYLLKINPDLIIISFNNDSSNNNAGNKAADKLKGRLLKYFNEDKIKIILPKTQKDWNDTLIKENKNSVIEQFSSYI